MVVVTLLAGAGAVPLYRLSGLSGSDRKCLTANSM